MSDLVLSEAAQLEQLRLAHDAAAGYLSKSRAQNTRRAYRSDWADFQAWCEAHGLASLPALPQTVTCYLADRAGSLAVSTLERRVSAISYQHRARKHDSPTSSVLVQDVMAGIRHEHGSAQVGKAPMLVEDLRAIVKLLPEDPAGRRDRALLLLGFAGAFRRSELVALDVEHLEVVRAGMVVHIGRSKTDQEGRGHKLGIPHGSRRETCPVRAVQAWLREAGIESGPVFRRVYRSGRVGEERLTDRAVALVIQRWAAAAGLDSDRLAGHSLRAGLCTEAAAAGVEEREIMAQSRHTSVQMVRRYIRDGQLFRGNAAGRVGL